MLTHLSIQNMTLVEQLELELDSGLTVLTGESGAGKSILLDALAMTLGEKSNSDKVRIGADKTQILAAFKITELKEAQQWLMDNDLADSDDCILRRTISKEGRSRAFINGQLVPLSQLKQLSSLLVNIHGQHAHHSLFNPKNHTQLIDDYGQCTQLAIDTKGLFTKWANDKKHLEALMSAGEENEAKIQLLRYQIEELDQLALQESELDALENEQKKLSSITTEQDHSQQLEQLVFDESNGLSTLTQQAKRLADLLQASDATLNIQELLQNAAINIDEAAHEIQSYHNKLEHDPERLHSVEQRLNTIYSIARKHRIQASGLSALHRQLTNDLRVLKPSDAHIEALEDALKTTLTTYQKQAQKLSQVRKKATKSLQKSVNASLASLSMANAHFEIDVTPNEHPTGNGNESMQFLISTQPGATAQALTKIASGGELSRISLAIQVATAQTSQAPTLIFDEVDVGIGGKTGDTVGRLLRQLGTKAQVLCITHLAQVASRGHQHLLVEKTVDKTSANSKISRLSNEDKTQEIARMMGGDSESEQSIAHATKMLETAKNEDKN